jgi:hypothetical protein
MKSLVVYESWFGNTRALADEVAGVLAREGDVEVVSVEDPRPPLDDVDLLVVGAPTHVHGLSSRRSREGAVDQGGHGDVGVGVRGWIDALPDGAAGPRVAVFDTRADKPVLLVGSAARGIARRLRRRGYTLVGQPQSFFVLGTPGPLADGELEHAADWARSLGEHAAAPA